MGDELERFRDEWKYQLEGGQKVCVSAPSRRESKTDNRDLLGKRNDKDESSVVLPDLKKKRGREPSPLLVLPSVETNTGTGCAVPPNATNKLALKKKTETLVDTLIADLNELNTIPFFDVQLPREIAVAIFRYLSVKELCVCTRVSKSWRTLAEDNVLWSGICHSLGYRMEADVSGGQVQWKSVVKNAVHQKRRVNNNWKERTCGLSDRRPNTSGRVSCAAYSQKQILFCCSSGEAYVWDVQGDWGLVELQQSRDTDTPTCCGLSNNWAVVGTSSGYLKVIDTQTQTQIHCSEDLGHVTSVTVASEEGFVAVLACADCSSPEFGVRSDVVMVKSEEGRDWTTSYLDIPQTKVSKLGLLPHSRLGSSASYDVIYSTQTTLAVQAFGSPASSATHFLTSEGDMGSSHISTFDHTSQTVACATSSHGYHVQLFDIRTAALMSTLKGHLQPVTAINIRHSPSNFVVTGSCDMRVCVYDYVRCSQPVMKLCGHGNVVNSVQMDDWKVVSGSADGVVIVWDQRMQSELWRLTERYPVGLCQFDETFLVIAHICSEPPLPDGYHSNLHKRQKGLLRVLDFSVDPRHYTTFLPSICSSTYNEPSASTYNLDLVYPYDFIG